MKKSQRNTHATIITIFMILGILVNLGEWLNYEAWDSFWGAVMGGYIIWFAQKVR